MFFLSENSDISNYTLINNKFFEQILPYIDSNYAKIYLMAYFYAMKNISVSNDELAALLHLDRNTLDNAFKFFSSCNMIKKHEMANGDYAVEFLSLDMKNAVCKIDDRPKADVLQIIEGQNNQLERMYERIEEIIGKSLDHYEIRQIDAFLVNYSVAYDVILEAFKFAYYKKKTRSVRDALKELTRWINSGVKTSAELDRRLEDENERYALYSKALRYFGEYRLPTKTEMQYLDRWTIDYNFDFEVIKKAMDESASIKNPNFKYINGILTNWYSNFKEKNPWGKKGAKKDFDSEEFALISSKIMDELKIEELSKEAESLISYLYKNFEKKEIIDEILKSKRSKKFGQEGIENAFDNLSEKEGNISKGAITLEDLGDIVVKNPNNPKFTNKKPEEKSEMDSKKTRKNTITDDYKDVQDYDNISEKLLSNNGLEEFLKEVK